MKFYALVKKNEQFEELFYSFDKGDWLVWQDGHGQLTTSEELARKANQFNPGTEIKELFYYDEGESKELLREIVKAWDLAESSSYSEGVFLAREFRQEFFRLVKPLIDKVKQYENHNSLKNIEVKGCTIA